MGVVAKYAFERLLKIPLEVDVASEFRYRDPILDDKTLVIIISQSGETADTLAALRMAKGKGCRILSIVNVVGSTIANESDDVLYTWAGPEIAVASTKAYSTQLAVIYMIALYMADQLGTVPEADMARYMADLQRLPDLAEAALADKETIQYFASRYFNAPRHVLHRPQRGLRRVLGGQLKAEGNQLHPLGGLHCRGTEARPHLPAGRWHPGHRHRHPMRSSLTR